MREWLAYRSQEQLLEQDEAKRGVQKSTPLPWKLVCPTHPSLLSTSVSGVSYSQAFPRYQP